MITTETKSQAIASIGEEISQELGAKMVKDFQDSYPAENKWYFIGRNIIDQILNQPDCTGIRFYNGLDEFGQKTLVFVGVDSKNEIIEEYSTINPTGTIVKHKGIVADRITKGRDTATTTTVGPFTITNW